MVPYLFLTFCIFFCCFYIPNTYAIKKSVTAEATFIFLAAYILLFFGLRGYVFTDWLNYYWHYAEVPTDWHGFVAFVQNPIHSSEIGYYVFQFLCKQISPNFFFLQFVSFFVDFIILWAFYKELKPKNFLLCIICMITFKGLEIEINLFRNSKAICLFMYSLKYIYKEKSLKKYMICNLIGCLFHLSALLYLPLYFVLDKRVNKLLYKIIGGGALFVMLLKIQFSYGMFAALCNYLPNGGLLIKITSYLNKGNTASIFSAISLERLCVFFMVVHFYKKLTKTKQGTVFVNLYLLYFISAFLFWDFGVVVQRFTLLFACSEWILVPELLYAFKRKDERILVMLLFMAYVAFKIYKDVVHSPWLSYTTCFNEVDYTVKAKTLRNLGF